MSKIIPVCDKLGANCDSVVASTRVAELGHDASWPSSATLVDATTESQLAPSLSQTGMILDNRAGAINQPSYARDYDRFDYWGFDNVVVDFGDSSLSWEYYSGWLQPTRIIFPA